MRPTETLRVSASLAFLPALFLAQGVIAQDYAPCRVFGEASPYTHVGANVADAGDVNGDGVHDIIVGLSTWRINGNGREFGGAWVISPTDGAVLYSLMGDTGEAKFGAAVAGLGDIDGDNRADFIVGAPGSVPGHAAIGRAIVYSGATGAVIYTFVGTLSNRRFGSAVASAGDINNDGVADIVIGEPQGSKAYVYSGADGLLLRMWSYSGIGAAFGAAVASAGDVDSDGCGDVIIGAPYASYVSPGGMQHNFAGLAKIYSGKTGEELFLVQGTASKQGVGVAVFGMGDLNGDGANDFAVATARFTSPPNRPTEIWAYSGATGERLFAVTEFEELQGIATLGDIDGDGGSELIVSQGSRVAVLRGADGAVLRENDFHMVPIGLFRSSVAAIGDANDDGIPDFVLAGYYVPYVGVEGRITMFCSGPPRPPLCLGDANYDAAVNMDDISSVIASWQDASFDPYASGDANHNGFVNFDDITTVLANWNTTCP